MIVSVAVNVDKLIIIMNNIFARSYVVVASYTEKS